MSDQADIFRSIASRLSGSMAPLTERDVNIQTPVQGGKATAGKKRKSGEKDAPNLDDIVIPEGTEITWNANQIRSKIRTYLSSGEMTVSAFQNAINVSSNSYYNFMNQSGPNNGTLSDTFMGAIRFFKKRQIAGIGMPRKKKAKAEGTTSKDSDETGKKTTKKQQADGLDVSDLQLDGEDNDSVPVFDTPDDVRTKINAHLRNTSASQASLLRALKAQYTTRPIRGLSPASLKTFLSHSGPAHGSSSPFTYAGYVYFEKLRLKQNKPKSKKRQEMETVWGKKGLDKDVDIDGHLWMHISEKMYVSQYGEVEIVRDGKMPKDGKGGVERKWKCY